jgi:hypothetical protein
MTGITMTEPAVTLCVVAAGVFFLSGLLTGAWKYFEITRSPDAVAPVYVDIAHRASLLYSFASLLLAVFAGLSVFSATVNLVAAALPLLFFALAIGGYIVHGVLRDTDNQLKPPFVLGQGHLPGSMIHGFMWALMAAEIGGFAVLFTGTLLHLLA